MMQLVLSAVQNAMTDSESVLSRAVHAALKVGVGKPAQWLFGDAFQKRNPKEKATSETALTQEPAALESAPPARISWAGATHEEKSRG